MAPMFEPIGDRARWRIVYDLLQKLDVGGILEYTTIGDALNLDPDTDRHAIQMAVRRAAKEHEEQDSRALNVVPNIGYRVVEAPEHLQLAQRHQKKSRRSLQRAQSKVVHVDLTGVDAEVRKAFEVTATALSMMADYTRRLDIRQRNLEKIVRTSQDRQDRSEEEIAQLRERLERLERGDS
jgi:hypothetical protein